MERIDWKDVGFTAVVVPGNSHFSFKLYEIKAAYDDGQIAYETAGGDFGAGDQTETLDNAQVYASGDIKWDGCSNLQFDEQEQVMLHFCGRRSWRDMSEAFERLYDHALKLYPQSLDLIGTRG